MHWKTEASSRRAPFELWPRASGREGGAKEEPRGASRLAVGATIEVSFAAVGVGTMKNLPPFWGAHTLGKLASQVCASGESRSTSRRQQKIPPLEGSR